MLENIRLGYRPFLYEVQSETDPNYWYGVYVNGETQQCQCLGFILRGRCKHLSWVRTLVGVEDVMLDEKHRVMLDKICMTFGSQMHAFDKQLLGAEWQQFRDDAWDWSIRKILQLVGEMYARAEHSTEAQQGLPVQHTQEAPKQDAPKEEDEKKTIITVASIQHRGSGTNSNGGAWNRYVLTDSVKRYWSIFNAQLIVGTTYEIEYEQNQRGRTIKKWKEVQAGTDG